MNFTKYITIALASTIKFVGGPLAGVLAKVSWWETAIASTIGMLFTVTIIVYGGSFLEKIYSRFAKPKKRKKFTTSIKFGVKVKKKLGLWGISFLTPLLFTPILGSYLALAFKFNKLEIILKMTVCGLFWGSIQTLLFQILGKNF